MGKVDPEQERRRLQKFYREKSDEELWKIGRDPRALTEWARDSLKQEMVRRGLEWNEVALPAPPRPASRPPAAENLLVLLRIYTDPAKAAEDKHLLHEAGVEAQYFSETAPGVDVRLLVRATDLPAGLKVLEEQDCKEIGGSDESEATGRISSKPVVLRAYRDITEAMIDRTALESAGIERFLYDDNLVRMDWFVSNAIGGVKLVVREDDASEAYRVLASAAG